MFFTKRKQLKMKEEILLGLAGAIDAVTEARNTQALSNERIGLSENRHHSERMQTNKKIHEDYMLQWAEQKENMKEIARVLNELIVVIGVHGNELSSAVRQLKGL